MVVKHEVGRGSHLGEQLMGKTRAREKLDGISSKHLSVAVCSAEEHISQAVNIFQKAATAGVDRAEVISRGTTQARVDAARRTGGLAEVIALTSLCGLS